MKQLEEGIFFIISDDLRKFQNLRCLDMEDCNIYLQPGRTRSQTAGRMKFVQLLSSFSCLQRLDVSYNYLLGCLGELLEALRHPLEFLSVRGCDLNEDDLEALASSKHCLSLRELNLSKLCQFSIYNNDRISPAFLLRIIPRFRNLGILNLAQNYLSDASIPDFCSSLAADLTNLAYLDIAGNVLTEENITLFVKTVGKIKSFQRFRVTCSNNLLEEIPAANHHALQLRRRFGDIWQSMGRLDIQLDIVRLSYAIFVDLLDMIND